MTRVEEQKIDLTLWLYIGAVELGFPEREVWRMTYFKLSELFRIHKLFHPERFSQVPKESDIDEILGMGGI